MKSKLVLLAVGCLLSASSGQYWTGPFQLTTDTFADINPSACKEFLPGVVTALVWQSNRNGNWDVFSRFDSLWTGSRWGPERAVTLDSFDDVNPVVACMNDSWNRPGFWCVWERRESSLVGSIWASFVRFGDSWQPPVRLGRAVHTDGDSAQPGVIVINGPAADTTWVVWRNHDTSGSYVSYVFNAGDSWTTEHIAVTADLRHARLGRTCVQYRQKPLLVWEQAGDIWYSIRDSSGWRTPAQVAPSASEDRNPDVVNSGPVWESYTYVVWQSTREGDTAIFIAAGDTFNVGQRVCNSSGAGTNVSPAGAVFLATTLDDWWCFVAWVSDRNGNPDIYTGYDYPRHDDWVDLDSANDIAPVVACIDGGGSQMAWVLWQSDRSGNWDVFGSFVYNSGIEESPRPHPSGYKPRRTVTRRLPAGASVFDAMGRRVTTPKAGVYFVRERSAVHKVVLAR